MKWKEEKNKTSQDEATETSSMTDKEKAKNAKKNISYPLDESSKLLPIEIMIPSIHTKFGLCLSVVCARLSGLVHSNFE